MKKKKKHLNGIPEVVKSIQKESVPALVQAGIGTAGMLVGTFGASKIPDIAIAGKVPVVGPYLAKTLPGLALIAASVVAAMYSKDDKVKAGATGVAIAGAVDILRRNGVLAKIQSLMPTPGICLPLAAQKQQGINGLNRLSGLGNYVPPGMPDNQYMNGIADSLKYSLGRSTTPASKAMSLMQA